MIYDHHVPEGNHNRHHFAYHLGYKHAFRAPCTFLQSFPGLHLSRGGKRNGAHEDGILSDAAAQPAVVPAIVGAFFSYWIFVHHELMFLDIIIYLAAMVGAVLLARRWRQSNLVRKYWPLWIVLVVVQLILTGYLTYNHPDWLVFADLG